MFPLLKPPQFGCQGPEVPAINVKQELWVLQGPGPSPFRCCLPGFCLVTMSWTQGPQGCSTGALVLRCSCLPALVAPMGSSHFVVSLLVFPLHVEHPGGFRVYTEAPAPPCSGEAILLQPLLSGHPLPPCLSSGSGAPPSIVPDVRGVTVSLLVHHQPTVVAGYRWVWYHESCVTPGHLG